MKRALVMFVLVAAVVGFVVPVYAAGFDKVSLGVDVTGGWMPVTNPGPKASYKATLTYQTTDGTQLQNYAKSLGTLTLVQARQDTKTGKVTILMIDKNKNFVTITASPTKNGLYSFAKQPAASSNIPTAPISPILQQSTTVYGK